MVATSPGHRAHSSHAGPAGVTSSTGTGQANLPQQLRLVVELSQAHPLPMRGETTAGVEPDEFGARGESGCSCSQLAPILHPTHFKEGLTFFSPPLPTPSPKLHPSSSNGARTPRGTPSHPAAAARSSTQRALGARHLPAGRLRSIFGTRAQEDCQVLQRGFLSGTQLWKQTLLD